MNQSMTISNIGTRLEQFHEELLADWVKHLKSQMVRQGAADDALVSHCNQFLHLLAQAAKSEDMDDTDGPPWKEVRLFLEDLSRARAKEGSTPSETATFVFSVKQPLFSRMRTELASQPEVLADHTWKISAPLCQLG